MNSTRRIRWGRIIIAAVVSEVVVVAVLLATTAVYRFLIAPGRSAAEYDAFGETASYYIAPIGAGLAVFACAFWVCRRLTSAFIANGLLVGVVAVILTGGFIFAAKPQDRLMYGVSFVLRIIGGGMGGATAKRSSGRVAATAVP